MRQMSEFNVGVTDVKKCDGYIKVSAFPKLCTFLLKVNRECYVIMYILFKVILKTGHVFEFYENLQNCSLFQ